MAVLLIFLGSVALAFVSLAGKAIFAGQSPAPVPRRWGVAAALAAGGGVALEWGAHRIGMF